MLTTQSFSGEIGGRTFTIESGELAEQATAAVTLRYGDTVLLVTICASDTPREGVDFLPLTVDYEERHYAVGKIPGGFIRREARPSQDAILTMRMTDRTVRPLLPKAWRNEIQIIITVLSADQENAPDTLAIIGSSAVLSLSEIPFSGPVSAVRVGYLDEQLVLNPPMSQIEDSQIDIIVASSKDTVVMVEAGTKEVSEDLVLRAIQFGHEANQAIIKLQEELQQACGKPKVATPVKDVNTKVIADISPIVDGKLSQALSHADKEQRNQALTALKKELIERLGELPEADIMTALDGKIKAEIRASLLKRRQRVNGRGLNEIRPLSCKVGLLPRTHGSGLFTRGQTQVLSIATLGSSRMEQQIDGLGIKVSKRFIHHYNFTPFSTGEVKRVGTPGRREIGHGALAERSLEPVIPKDEDFPYTIRLVSEVLSSSGSTSMASVCASSLSMMDAGIPIKRAVAGIAMGLVTDDEGNYAILTDIEGTEDNYGDMDFKVAGTTEGITGLQMDTKIKGLSMEIVAETLQQAREARLSILEVMSQTINSYRAELSQYAPRMQKITIAQEKIGSIIGPGGKTIRSIIEQTKTTIDIDNDGTVVIGSLDEAAARRAIEMIQNLTKDVEAGSVYTGKVTRLLNFGVMVEILPGKEGLVHISELADYRVAKVEDIVKVGDEITVKVTEVDNIGRINLSRRAVLAASTRTPDSQTGNSPSPDYPFRNQQDSRPPQNKWQPKS